MLNYDISQGSVAALFKCDGNFNDIFVLTFHWSLSSISEKILNIGRSLAKI